MHALIEMPRPSDLQELRQTVELARVLSFVINYSVANHPAMSLTRAGARMTEALIDALRKAGEELAPCPDLNVIEREIARLQARIGERKEALAAV